MSFTNLRRQFSEDGFRDVFFHIHLVIMGSIYHTEIVASRDFFRRKKFKIAGK